MGKISERYDARGAARYLSLPNKQEHKKEERSFKNRCQYF